MCLDAPKMHRRSSELAVLGCPERSFARSGTVLALSSISSDPQRESRTNTDAFFNQKTYPRLQLSWGPEHSRAL